MEAEVMSRTAAIPGDQARVSVLVRRTPSDTFRIFTEEIDQWWRRGRRYRLGKDRTVVHLEPKLGGRLFESFESGGRERVVETGRITEWEPPSRLVIAWRAVDFAPDEVTEVEVLFAGSPTGTMVTVIHRGWSQIRGDHPVRHGQNVSAFLRTMGLFWGDLMSTLRETALKDPPRS